MTCMCRHTAKGKKVVPQTFCNIFTSAKYISVKFCQFVGNLYPHIFTNFNCVWIDVVVHKHATMLVDNNDNVC